MPNRHMAEWRYSSTLTSALQVSSQSNALDITSGKNPHTQYPMDRRLCKNLTWSAKHGEEK
jgi:hypothetical protein